MLCCLPICLIDIYMSTHFLRQSEVLCENVFIFYTFANCEKVFNPPLDSKIHDFKGLCPLDAAETVSSYLPGSTFSNFASIYSYYTVSRGYKKMLMSRWCLNSLWQKKKQAFFAPKIHSGTIVVVNLIRFKQTSIVGPAYLRTLIKFPKSNKHQIHLK